MYLLLQRCVTYWIHATTIFRVLWYDQATLLQGLGTTNRLRKLLSHCVLFWMILNLSILPVALEATMNLYVSVIVFCFILRTNIVLKGAEITVTRYLDLERYKFVYINGNQEPKQLADFHHLIYCNSVYSNNFVSLIL